MIAFSHFEATLKNHLGGAKEQVLQTTALSLVYFITICSAPVWVKSISVRLEVDKEFKKP